MTERSKHFRGALGMVAAAALLAGCSLIPTYERPVAPVPTTFPNDPAQPVGAAAATVAWQDYFTDARLQGLITTALANNRDLRVWVLNIEQARAQFQIQRSALFPAVGVSASGSRSSPNPYQAFGVGGSVASNYSVNLGITAWEIDFFGRIASLKEQALAQYLATEESRKATQISLISAVASGWLTLIADDELLDLTRQTLQTRDESVRLTKLRFDAGVSSEIDFQLANSLAETARASYAQQQRLRAQDENALALLLGAPVPAEALSGGALRLDAAAPMRELPAGLPSDLLTERPDIRAAEQQLISANASIGAARANFFRACRSPRPSARPAASSRTCSTAAPRPGPSHRRSRCRSSTPVPTRPRSTARVRASRSLWRNTRSRFKRPSAKSPTHWPAGPRWAKRCVRCAHRPRPRACASS